MKSEVLGWFVWLGVCERALRRVEAAAAAEAVEANAEGGEIVMMLELMLVCKMDVVMLEMVMNLSVILLLFESEVSSYESRRRVIEESEAVVVIVVDVLNVINEEMWFFREEFEVMRECLKDVCVIVVVVEEKFFDFEVISRKEKKVLSKEICLLWC